MTHRVSRDEGGVLRSPAPALVVATPVAVGDEVAAGAPVLVLESMKMETVLPAPFAARVKELLVATGSQVETGAPLRPARARRRRRRGGRRGRGRRGPRPRPARATPPPATAAERAARGRADLCGDAARLRPRPARRGQHPARPTSRPATSSPPTGGSPLGDEIDAARGVRRLRRAQPQPAGRRGGARREPGAQPARALPHLPAEPRPRARRAARATSAGRLARVLRALRRHRPRPHARARGGGLPGLPRPAALAPPTSRMATAILQRWLVEPGPEAPARRTRPARCSTGWSSATQLRFPIVGDLARSVRFRWFDQPLVDADRASRCSAGVRDELDQLDAMPDGDRARRAHRRARRHPRADRALPRRAARARRARARADARGAHQAALPRARPARPARGDRRRAGRSRRRLHPRRAGRPHLVTTVGTVDELTPTARLGRALLAARGRDRPRRPRGRRRPLPALARRARQTPEEASERSRARLARLPFASHGAPRRRRASCPGDERDRSATSPSAPPPTAPWSRTASSAACTRWSGAGSTSGGCATSSVTRLEAPEDVLLYHCRRPGQPAGPAPRGARPGAPARRRARRDGQGHRAAARRARHRQLPRGDPPGAQRTRRRRRPPRHEPRVGAHLAAGRGRPRPADRPAGQDRADDGRRRHRGGPASQGAIAGPDGAHRAPICGAVLLPAGVGRGHLHRRGSRRPSGSSRSTTTPQKVVRARRRGLVYPYELRVDDRRAGGHRAVEHDLDDTGPARAGRPPLRPEQGGHHRRCRHDPDARCTPRA